MTSPPDGPEAPPCTGLAATWCPIHGDCSCETYENGERSLSDRGCPLHGPLSTHSENAEDAPGDHPCANAACIAGVNERATLLRERDEARAQLATERVARERLEALLRYSADNVMTVARA